MDPNIVQPTQPVRPEIQTPITQPSQSTPSTPSGKTKYILLAVLILIILLVVGGAYYMGVVKQPAAQKNSNLTTVTVSPSPNPTSIPSPISTATVDDAKQLLSGFQNTLKTHSTITAFQYDHWVLADGSDTFTKGFNFSLAAKTYQGGNPGPGYVDAYGNIQSGVNSGGSSYQDPQGMLAAINDLKAKSDNFFLGKGFKINAVNSSKDHNANLQTINGITLGGLDETIAYEKNGLFCQSSFNQGSETYASFSCGIVDEAQNTLQNTIGKELQPLYNPTNDPNIEILVQKVVGDFVVGGVGGKNGGGEGFYAKKINGVWTNILTTQNGLPCSLAQKYEMPPELSQGCIQGQ